MLHRPARKAPSNVGKTMPSIILGVSFLFFLYGTFVVRPYEEKARLELCKQVPTFAATPPAPVSQPIVTGGGSSAIAEENAALLLQIEALNENVGTLTFKLKESEETRVQLQSALNARPDTPTPPPVPVSAPAVSAPVPAGGCEGTTGSGPLSGIPAYPEIPNTALSLVRSDDRHTPGIVQAFHRGKIDWHQFMPEIHDTGSKDFNFHKLVETEIKLAAMLMADHSGNRWGHDHGPLASHAMCDLVKDKCSVHQRNVCLTNSFCGWCESQEICLEFKPGEKNDNEMCETPLEGTQRAKTQCPTSGSSCQIFVHERHFDARPSGGQAAMYYQWHQNFFNHMFSEIGSKGGLVDLSNHIVVSDRDRQTKFYPFFGVVSNYCYRWQDELPRGTCWCNDVPNGESQNKDYLAYILHRLDLSHVEPKRRRMGIVARRQKRFILNEYDMIAKANEMGFESVFLPLEDMTLYEQIRELRQVTTLVGMHGSGLVNTLFVPRNGVVVQIMPYKVTDDGNYISGFIRQAGVEYIQWVSEDREKTVIHWHFLNAGELARKEQIIQRGGTRSLGAGLYFGFWIQQDTIVDMAKFQDLLQQSKAKGLNTQLPGPNGS